MERLTGRDKEGTYLKLQGCAKGEKIWCIDDREFINAYYGKQMLDKLAEFEDFMEKYKINGLKELESILCDLMTFEREKISYQIENEELQAYKKAWKKLKNALHDQYKIDDREYDKTGIATFAHYIAFNNWVLDKMQELEPKTEGKDE